ncbi:alkaline phosphatase family protein [Sphingosinicella sp. LY1275]|uniref:alkaline phosphatase family protein n=1 Tax=Sphingosinicella sp. LY1275 TaxID=3095379 RepID=UPI002ADEF530|nr:alkaline phosphatase family protein [Sphingosinicella sp. LY1275]MEA1015547.1 alkaline phosphatase family protein [Sphingosinicella sp. LY1275]
MSQSPGGFTRRRLLKSTTQASALAAAATLMPPNVQKLLAKGRPSRGSLRDIKHVVLLMQENRSFDHYFGTMAGVRGFGDPHALTLPNGRSVFHQPDAENPKGYMLPFHLDTFSTSAQRLPSTGHSWKVQHNSWNGGRMDRWLPTHRAADGAHGPYTMGYFKREDIPFHHALAEAFTICDSYHCSVLGSTRPNRFYYLTGTLDPEGLHGGPIISQKTPPEGLRWKTYAERLEEAGVSWRVYQHADDGTGFNVLRLFRQFMDSPPGSPLRVKGMPSASDGQFEYDALHDRLPAVTWLCPTNEGSEHPNNSSPAGGAEFIAGKLDAIAANPDVWAKTVFILNYDENDGLFDHVPPPVPPEGVPGEYVNGVPIGAGFRVPCILVSPWTAGGWVCSQPFDHTSVLQFLERFTGVREPNISDWRRRTFGDLTAAFRFGEPASPPPVLPSTSGLLHHAHYAAQHLPAPPIPGAEQAPPVQEKGRRRRTPLANQNVGQP